MRKISDLEKGRKKEQKKVHNVWRSYSDMMSGLLLLFVLVMAVSFIEAQRSYEAELQSQQEQEKLSEELEKQQKELKIRQEQLEKQQVESEKQQIEIAEQKARLEEQEIQLEEKQIQSEEQRSILEQQKQQLEDQQSILEQQKQQLEEQQVQLNEQSILVESQKKIMSEQQKKIDNIIGVKAELIAALQKEFQESNLEVSIDEETGAITFDSNILFEYDKSILTEDGKNMLRKMLPVYCMILLEDKYVDYLSEIIIDGFTDTEGSYIYNLKLSQNRAYAVAEFLLSIKQEFLSGEQEEILEAKISVNGRSESNPIFTADDQIDMDASRRVEVKFRLKDDEMITELQNIMKESGNE